VPQISKDLWVVRCVAEPIIELQPTQYPTRDTRATERDNLIDVCVDHPVDFGVHAFVDLYARLDALGDSLRCCGTGCSPGLRAIKHQPFVN
jgi:hypothetical protein